MSAWDKATGARNTVTYPHHEIHSGSSYVVSDVQNVDTTTMQWMVTVPNVTKWPHMVFAFEANGEMQIVIKEGADRNGTNLLSAYNRNRNSTNKAGVIIHRAASGGTTDGATTLFSLRGGSTNVAGKTISGGSARDTNEWVLMQNTKYIVTVTTYANVYVSAIFDWYEHTDN